MTRIEQNQIETKRKERKITELNNAEENRICSSNNEITKIHFDVGSWGEMGPVGHNVFLFNGLKMPNFISFYSANDFFQ